MCNTWTITHIPKHCNLSFSISIITCSLLAYLWSFGYSPKNKELKNPRVHWNVFWDKLFYCFSNLLPTQILCMRSANRNEIAVAFTSVDFVNKSGLLLLLLLYWFTVQTWEWDQWRKKAKESSKSIVKVSFLHFVFQIWACFLSAFKVWNYNLLVVL